MEDGPAMKFFEEVEHRTFSGPEAARRGKEVLYITERCVFRLGADGLELCEIAPGVDLQHDILDKMAFRPLMPQPPVLMDERIFADAPMGIRPQLLDKPLAERLSYDAAQNLFFLDFSGLAVRSSEDIERIEAAVEGVLQPIGHKVRAVVNYDRFSIAPELIDAYIAMVKRVVEAHYHEVTRYTASSFLRLKLGEALARGQLPVQLYGSAQAAQAALAN